MEKRAISGDTRRTVRARGAALLFCVCLAAAASAHGSVALLMEEPYANVGAMKPTGHAAVYFNHICAESPTLLRTCRDGEYGTVISRYHNVDGYDWLAIPLVGYLYAVNSPSDIPPSVDKEQLAALREAYRKEHLLELTPDRVEDPRPKGDWTELVGSSFDRTIHGFQVDSNHAQDVRFITAFNNRRNVGHFNLLFHNSADFSRVVLDIYMPHAIRRDLIADVGLMTAKQVARALVRYGRKHPELNMNAFVIPQVPGSIQRSHPVEGVAESLVKSKKYLLPIVFLAPEVTCGAVVAYLVDGRLKPPQGAAAFHIGDQEITSTPDPHKELPVPSPQASAASSPAPPHPSAQP